MWSLTNGKSMIRAILYCVVWLIAATSFVLAFFEREHRSFEGWPTTLLLSTMAAIFSVLWVVTMKCVRVETGGVYGRQHDRIVRIFGTAWAPLKLGMVLLASVGLGSVAGGAIMQGIVSTQGVVVLIASCGALLLCHYFEMRGRGAKTTN
jgi:hypothetical protein